MEWVQQNLGLVIGVVVVVLLVWALTKLLPKKKVIADEYKLNVQCKKCKWGGIVTKYNAVCPKCNSRDLDVL